MIHKRTPTTIIAIKILSSGITIKLKVCPKGKPNNTDHCYIIGGKIYIFHTFTTKIEIPKSDQRANRGGAFFYFTLPEIKLLDQIYLCCVLFFS